MTALWKIEIEKFNSKAANLRSLENTEINDSSTISKPGTVTRNLCPALDKEFTTEIIKKLTKSRLAKLSSNKSWKRTHERQFSAQNTKKSVISRFNSPDRRKFQAK
jgi:hypothetical protein